MLVDYYLQRTIKNPASPLVEKEASPDTLKRLAELDTLVFTSLSLFHQGEPTLSQYFAVEDQTLASKQHVLQVGASLAAASKLPGMQAIFRSAKESGVPIREIETDPVAGTGITGKLERTWYVFGDESVMRAEAIELGVTSRALMQQLEMNGKQIFFLAQRQPKRLLGIFACDQGTVPEAAEAIQSLKDLGIEMQLLTSQRTRLTKAITSKLGVELVNSELNEEQKNNIIASLQENNSRIAFVGLLENRSLLRNVPFPIIVAPEALARVPLTVSSLIELPGIIRYARTTMNKTKKIFFWCKL